MPDDSLVMKRGVLCGMNAVAPMAQRARTIPENFMMIDMWSAGKKGGGPDGR